MFNSQDILAMLNSGQDADAIAQNFADALNDARLIQKKNAEQKAAATRQKISDAQVLLDTLFDFVTKYYPDMAGDSMSEMVNAAQLVDIMDQAQEEVKKMMPMLDLFASIDSGDKKGSGPAPTGKLNVGDVKISPKKLDPLSEFLQQYNL